MTVLWIWGSRYIYSRLYGARRLLVIYGDRDPGDDLIHKMNTRKDKYDISGKVHIRVGEEKIHQMMQDYDGVIIWDLRSREKQLSEILFRTFYPLLYESEDFRYHSYGK